MQLRIEQGREAEVRRFVDVIARLRGPANSPPEAGSIRHSRPIEFAT
jgi:hypothetical protein